MSGLVVNLAMGKWYTRTVTNSLITFVLYTLQGAGNGKILITALPFNIAINGLFSMERIYK